MRKLRLMDNYRFHVAQRSEVESDLVRLRRKLGWSKRNEVPSVWFMAKHVNEERRYRFLYFATSRAVHFNVHELVRRCWGKPGKIVVDSDHFEEYWARFALSWGLRLYVDVLLLEPISKSFKQYQQGCELHKAQEVFRIVLPARHNTALPLEPGKKALDLPPPRVAT